VCRIGSAVAVVDRIIIIKFVPVAQYLQSWGQGLPRTRKSKTDDWAKRRQKRGVCVAVVARNADAERGRGRSPRCRRNARTPYHNNIRTVRYLNHYNIYAHTCVACWHAIRVNNNDTIHKWYARVYSRTNLRIINIVISYYYFARRPINGRRVRRKISSEGERTAQNLS